MMDSYPDRGRSFDRYTAPIDGSYRIPLLGRFVLGCVGVQSPVDGQRQVVDNGEEVWAAPAHRLDDLVGFSNDLAGIAVCRSNQDPGMFGLLRLVDAADLVARPRLR